jgi:hypothetical protein
VVIPLGFIGRCGRGSHGAENEDTEVGDVRIQKVELKVLSRNENENENENGIGGGEEKTIR